MVTAYDLSPEAMAGCREGARRRQEAERRALAAALLRQRFAVGRVVVFGSLIHPGCFTPWSDVDIAAWGLHPDDTFRAIGVAMDVDTEIAVNLVDVGACSPALNGTASYCAR